MNETMYTVRVVKLEKISDDDLQREKEMAKDIDRHFMTRERDYGPRPPEYLDGVQVPYGYRPVRELTVQLTADEYARVKKAVITES